MAGLPLGGTTKRIGWCIKSLSFYMQNLSGHKSGHNLPYITSPSTTVASTFVPKISCIGIFKILRSSTTKSAFFPGISEPSSCSAKDAYAASSVIPFRVWARVSRCSGYLRHGVHLVHDLSISRRRTIRLGREVMFHQQTDGLQLHKIQAVGLHLLQGSQTRAQ